MEFDTVKENIQPLRGGRRADRLETVLGGEKDVLEQERKEHEEAINTYTGLDPLDNWYSYICWIEQSYPQSGNQSGLQEVVAKCIKKFENDMRYQQDRRLIKLFIKYIDTQDNPHEIYEQLYNHGIGTMVSDLYIAWSYYFDAVNDFKKAESIFQKGFNAGAQPYDELAVAHQVFSASISKRLLYDDEASRKQFQETMDEKRNALTTLRAYKKKFVGSVRLGSAIKSLNPGIVPINENAEGNGSQKVNIHSDEAGFSGEFEAHSSGIKSIFDIAKKVENVHEAGPWNKATKSHNKNVQLFDKKSSQPGFSIMEDESLPPISYKNKSYEKGCNLPSNFASKNNPQTPWNIPIVIEEPSVPNSIPCYDKFLLYPAPDIEISLEESRAYRWFKSRNIKDKPIISQYTSVYENKYEYGSRMIPGFMSKNTKQDNVKYPLDYDLSHPGFQFPIRKMFDGQTEYSNEELLAEKFKRGEIILISNDDFEETLMDDNMDMTLIGDRRESVYCLPRKSFVPRKSILRKSVMPAYDEDGKQLETATKTGNEHHRVRFEEPIVEEVDQRNLKRKLEIEEEEKLQNIKDRSSSPESKRLSGGSSSNDDFFKPPPPPKTAPKQPIFEIFDDENDETFSTKKFNCFIKSQSVSTPINTKKSVPRLVPLTPIEQPEISPKQDVTEPESTLMAQNNVQKQLSTIIEVTETTNSTKSSVSQFSGENEADSHARTKLSPIEVASKSPQNPINIFRLPEEQTETTPFIKSILVQRPIKMPSFQIFEETLSSPKNPMAVDVPIPNDSIQIANKKGIGHNWHESGDDSVLEVPKLCETIKNDKVVYFGGQTNEGFEKETKNYVFVAESEGFGEENGRKLMENSKIDVTKNSEKDQNLSNLGTQNLSAPGQHRNSINQEKFKELSNPGKFQDLSNPGKSQNLTNAEKLQNSNPGIQKLVDSENSQILSKTALHNISIPNKSQATGTQNKSISAPQDPTMQNLSYESSLLPKDSMEVPSLSEFTLQLLNEFESPEEKQNLRLSGENLSKVRLEGAVKEVFVKNAGTIEIFEDPKEIDKSKEMEIPEMRNLSLKEVEHEEIQETRVECEDISALGQFSNENEEIPDSQEVMGSELQNDIIPDTQDLSIPQIEATHIEIPETQEFSSQEHVEIPATQEMSIKQPIDNVDPMKPVSKPTFFVYEDSVCDTLPATKPVAVVTNNPTSNMSRKENLIVTADKRSNSDEFLELCSKSPQISLKARAEPKNEMSDLLKFSKSKVSLEVSFGEMKINKPGPSPSPTMNILEADLNTENFNMPLKFGKNSTIIGEAVKVVAEINDYLDLSIEMNEEECEKLGQKKPAAGTKPVDKNENVFKVPMLPKVPAEPQPCEDPKNDFVIFEDDQEEDDDDDDLSKSIYHQNNKKDLSIVEHQEEDTWEDNKMCSFIANDRNRYEYTIIQEEDEYSVSIKLRQAIMKSQGNPFTTEIRKLIMEQCFFEQYLEENIKSCTLLKNVPQLKTGMSLQCGNDTYRVGKMLGKGAFGTVFEARDVKTNRLFAAKQEKPANLWEYYILIELQSRLDSKKLNRMIPAYMHIYSAVIANNASIFISEYSHFGTIIDVCNKIKCTTGRNVDEYIGMIFASQLLSIIDFLHSCHIIHADIKPDNFLLMSKIDIGMKVPALQLIDFGSAIDMEGYDANDQFTHVVNTENFTCCEMLEKKPWTYQTDLFGICGTTHVIIFGKYMEVEKKIHNWQIKTRYPRYFQKDLWEIFFSALLNVPDCKSMPNLQHLKQQLDEEILGRRKYILDKVNEFNNALINS